MEAHSAPSGPVSGSTPGADVQVTPPAASARPEAIEAIPVRHWGRWIAAAIVALLMVALIYSLARNPRIGWDTVGEYLFKELTLLGVLRTIELTIIAMVMGIIGGTLLAVMRLSGNPILSSMALAYIWFFRGTPVLVQLIFWFFLGALYPRIFIGIPFTDIAFISADSNRIISGFTASIFGLGFNEMAYAAELVRAGIISVDKGQTEAAQSLGMSGTLTMRRIVLPQAMRVIIPPMGNETISMLKTTSLVSVISGADLLTRLQQVYAQTFEVIPLLIVASIWYLALTTVLSIGQYYLERHYGRGIQPRAHRRGRRPPGPGIPVGLRPDADRAAPTPGPSLPDRMPEEHR